MQLHFSDSIVEKLKEKHNVDVKEVFECFFNRGGEFLVDEREDHKTDPPTKWFISETDKGRSLKICFIEFNGKIAIKTAYDANAQEIRIYNKFAK